MRARAARFDKYPPAAQRTRRVPPTGCLVLSCRADQQPSEELATAWSRTPGMNLGANICCVITLTGRAHHSCLPIGSRRRLREPYARRMAFSRKCMAGWAAMFMDYDADTVRSSKSVSPVRFRRFPTIPAPVDVLAGQDHGAVRSFEDFRSDGKLRVVQRRMTSAPGCGERPSEKTTLITRSAERSCHNFRPQIACGRRSLSDQGVHRD
jgi:hypothetical protein